MKTTNRIVTLTLLFCACAGMQEARAEVVLEVNEGSIARSLDEAMSRAATQIAASVGEEKLIIGPCTGPSTLDAGAGPGITFRLQQELKKLKVEVTRAAKYRLRIDYNRLRIREASTQQERISVEIAGTLEEGKQIVAAFNQYLIGAEEVAQFLGLSADFSPSQTENGPSQESLIYEAITQPQAAPKNFTVYAGPNSHYGIELLKKTESGYEPLQPTVQSGLSYVELQRSDVYAVKVINHSSNDAAVRLGIDGLSMFAFSDNSYKHFILPAKSNAVIRGWHRSNTVTNEFLVGRYSNSPAAGILFDPTSVGVITATFSPAWSQDEKLPGGQRAGNLATHLGPPVNQTYEVVHRRIGDVSGIVSVRYAPSLDKSAN